MCVWLQNIVNIDDSEAFFTFIHSKCFPHGIMSFYCFCAFNKDLISKQSLPVKLFVLKYRSIRVVLGMMCYLYSMYKGSF